MASSLQLQLYISFAWEKLQDLIDFELSFPLNRSSPHPTLNIHLKWLPQQYCQENVNEIRLNQTRYSLNINIPLLKFWYKAVDSRCLPGRSCGRAETCMLVETSLQKDVWDLLIYFCSLLCTHIFMLEVVYKR